MIDWRMVLTTFVSVFLAELGDKTQLATLGFAGESRSPLSVFVGSAAALVCTSALAVLAGGIVQRYVSPLTLRRAAGTLFIVLGVIALVRQ